MQVEDLESLKYHELQKLAKSVGIKANQKINKLIKALQDHYAVTAKGTPTGRSSKNKQDRISDGGKNSNGDAKPRENETGSTKKGTITTNFTKRNSQDKASKNPRSRTASRSPANGASTGLIKERRTGSLNKNSPNMFSPLHRQVVISKMAGKRESNKAQTMNKSASRTPEPSSDLQNKPNRKRRRTFEMDEPTLSRENTPTVDDKTEKRNSRSSKRNTPNTEDEPANKKIRKDIVQPLADSDGKRSTRSSSSPATKAMIDSMDANKSSAERKAHLMNELNRKFQGKGTASPTNTTTCNKPSQIPRFMAFLQASAVKPEKPQTPGSKDWTKIHQKEFSKFDSIDDYLNKKQKRKDMLTNSGKRLNVARPVNKHTNNKIVKPVVKPQAHVKPFVPTVTSTKNLSLNFGASKTPSKQINNKTPVRPKSSVKRPLPNGNLTKTPNALNTTVAVTSSRKSVGLKSGRASPYRFTGNTSSLNATVNSSKKAFDLKASLAKPLSWKPHTGKLQPLDFNKGSQSVGITAAPPKPIFSLPAKAGPQSLSSKQNSRQAMASKTRAAGVKNVRRAEQLDRRNNQKYIDMMRRRGLMA